MPFAFARECRGARPALGRSDSGATCRFGVLAESDLEATRHGPGGSADRRGSPPRASGQDDSVSRNHLAYPETGSQGRRGRCGAKASWSRASAPRRPRGNRPRKVPVARSASGFRFFGPLKINIVAPAGEPLEIPGNDSARPRRVTASQGAAGAARGVGASRNAGFAADSAYAQDRPARYRTVTISAFWSA